jgi:hypothetical protein
VTGAIMQLMDTNPAHDDAPPPGTAIVRPLRHVRAVRERYLLRFTDPSQATASRSARAWAWALGETTTAPVTDQQTPTPPSRRAIEAEIAVADGRRLRDEEQDRADAAATILRWLIGDDDHVPVRTDSPGELVGGFGHVVRSAAQMASVQALAIEGQQEAATSGRDLSSDPVSHGYAGQEVDYLEGVAATLAWVIGERPGAPISHDWARPLTTRDLKRERVRADDVIEQAGHPWMVERRPSSWYGEGVRFTISLLLGDLTAPPVDPAGHGPYDPASELLAMFRDAEARQRSG